MLIVGEMYELHTEMMYNQGKVLQCIHYCPEDVWENTYVIRNILSGWTMKCHGVTIYSDGSIAWEFSTGGYFDI